MSRIIIRINGGLVQNVYSEIEELDISVIDDDVVEDGYVDEDEIQFYNETLAEAENLKDHY